MKTATPLTAETAGGLTLLSSPLRSTGAWQSQSGFLLLPVASLATVQTMRMEQDVLDPVAVERAEKSIDELMNSRSKAKDKANAEADLWRISERRQREKQREEHRLAWHSYEMHMCELHASLSEEHRVKALTFLKQIEGVAAVTR